MPVFTLPNRDNIKKWTCPHCGRSMEAYRIPKHENACPKQPETMARLAEVLPDPANPEMIISYHKYKAIRANETELPSWTIIESTWGEWADVAHAFGLVTSEEFEQRSGGVDALLPATVAELQRLSNELYGGTIGPNHSDYMESYDPATGAQATKTLEKKLGNWDNVLAAVGLVHESRTYYWQARVDRRKAAKKAAAEALTGEAALNAPLGPNERMAAPEVPERPIVVVAAHKLPDGKGMLYKLPKLTYDRAPSVYGITVAAVVVTPREERYILK